MRFIGKLTVCLCLDVKELTQQCVGVYDLLQQRQKIQLLSDETNQHLKKNVYQNYMQFIETAKEISCELPNLVENGMKITLVFPSLQIWKVKCTNCLIY